MGKAQDIVSLKVVDAERCDNSLSISSEAIEYQWTLASSRSLEIPMQRNASAREKMIVRAGYPNGDAHWVIYIEGHLPHKNEYTEIGWGVDLVIFLATELGAGKIKKKKLIFNLWKQGWILQQWEVLCTPLRTLLVASGETLHEGCETDINLKVQPYGCVVRLHLAASTFPIDKQPNPHLAYGHTAEYEKKSHLISANPSTPAPLLYHGIVAHGLCRLTHGLDDGKHVEMCAPAKEISRSRYMFSWVTVSSIQKHGCSQRAETPNPRGKIMTTRATSAAWTTTSRMVNRLVGCVPHAGFFSIRYGFRFCMSLIGTPVVVHVHGGGGGCILGTDHKGNHAMSGVDRWYSACKIWKPGTRQADITTAAVIVQPDGQAYVSLGMDAYIYGLSFLALCILVIQLPQQIRIWRAAKTTFDRLSRHGSCRRFTAFRGGSVFAEYSEWQYIYAVVEDGSGMPGASTENEASIHMHGHFERILRISAQKSLQASRHQR
ncbi:hypothetical protein PCH_Pc21g12560 [Penicillium rubens Wisconsin 54-1255]|uniref:Uncharacterized protein n=1 Tax=Penicillium rubens (strain ATCC 28089 / DSM 1075 / NRRL 1951 / Wisconsin 54-1255) TaxID=500485 RepID=B6HLP2_PENRW|nr:hypothetical protein PCH_Pc21g12560 [Penicillium rubens Wisconsin 54-1255]